MTQLKNLRRPGFDLWVGKSPWRRERLPTPVFWPGEFHGLYSPWGRKEPDTTEHFYWRTEKPGVSQSMGSQRAGQDSVAEQQQ